MLEAAGAERVDGTGLFAGQFTAKETPVWRFVSREGKATIETIVLLTQSRLPRTRPQTANSHQDAGSPEESGRSIDLLTPPTESYTVTETIGWLFLICRPACSAAS